MKDIHPWAADSIPLPGGLTNPGRFAVYLDYVDMATTSANFLITINTVRNSVSQLFSQSRNYSFWLETQGRYELNLEL